MRNENTGSEADKLAYHIRYLEAQKESKERNKKLETAYRKREVYDKSDYAHIFGDYEEII